MYSKAVVQLSMMTIKSFLTINNSIVYSQTHCCVIATARYMKTETVVASLSYILLLCKTSERVLTHRLLCCVYVQ